MEDRTSCRQTNGVKPPQNENIARGRGNGDIRTPLIQNRRDFEGNAHRGAGRGGPHMNRIYPGQNMNRYQQQGSSPYYNQNAGIFGAAPPFNHHYQMGYNHQAPTHYSHHGPPQYNHHGPQQQYNQQRQWRQQGNGGGGGGPWGVDDRVHNPCYNIDPEMQDLLDGENISFLKRKSVRFPNALFFCRLCEFHMDDLKSCISHVQNLRHQRLATEMDFNKFLKTLPMASDAMAEAVGDLILRTSEEVGLSSDDVREREDAVAELQAKLSEAMPGAHLEITGSMYSGLALNTSDVNVSLVLPENVSHCEPLMELLRIINETPTYTDVVNDLRSSTFPCLSYRSEKHGGCRVVIGVGSASVRAMGRLMATYAALDKRFLHIARALLLWAKMCGVCDQKKGSLPSIAYVVLVVNFLQQTQPPVLPVLSVLCPSGKPEDFPLPKDVKTNFVSKNFQSIGELWLDMVRYFGYIFQFNSHNVSITTTKPSPRLEKNAKKMSILDPFNSKKILSRSLSNSAVSEYIVDKLFKVLCRYFCVPQLSYGQLFFSLTVNDSILKEKRRNCDRQKLSSESDKNTESETENNKNISDYDLAMDRLEDLKLSDSECEKLTHGISSADDLSHTFDSMTCGEALRCIKLLKPCHLKYAFNQETFTEGESVPIYCSLCQKEGHIRDDCEEEKLPELLPLPDIDAEQDKLLTNLLRRLLHELEPSPEEVEKREKLVEKLQHFVSKEYKYKDAVLQLFGSSANGFGFRNSDLDICITFEDERHKDAIDHNFLIQDLCRILRTSGQFLNVHSIPQAKVPIVKFRCAMTGLDGDLSLYNTLALRNTRLLNIYSQIDPRVKMLGYGLKYFAKKCDICDASRGSLSSYAFSLMLLHFLQHTQPPVLPVLQELYDPDEGKPTPVMVEGWDTWFFSDLDRLRDVWPGLGANKCSAGQLWLQMFRYYTEIFNFDDCVITIRQFAPLTRLKKLWNTRSIAIEDPFNLNHNLGGALSAKMNTFIRKAFINGRHLYGGLLDVVDPKDDPALSLFDPKILTCGDPPNDRGCRRCGKIGHIVKNCTGRRDADSAGGKKNRGAKGKTDGGRKDVPSDGGAAASGPVKKRDDKCFIGELGMRKIYNACPPDVKCDTSCSGQEGREKRSPADPTAVQQVATCMSRMLDQQEGPASSSWRFSRGADHKLEEKSMRLSTHNEASLVLTEEKRQENPFSMKIPGQADDKQSSSTSESAQDSENDGYTFGTAINVLQLFSIANECGGTLSCSSSNSPVMEKAVHLTSLEAGNFNNSSEDTALIEHEISRGQNPGSSECKQPVRQSQRSTATGSASDDIGEGTLPHISLDLVLDGMEESQRSLDVDCEESYFSNREPVSPLTEPSSKEYSPSTESTSVLPLSSLHRPNAPKAHPTPTVDPDMTRLITTSQTKDSKAMFTADKFSMPPDQQKYPSAAASYDRSAFGAVGVGSLTFAREALVPSSGAIGPPPGFTALPRTPKIMPSYDVAATEASACVENSEAYGSGGDVNVNAPSEGEGVSTLTAFSATSSYDLVSQPSVIQPTLPFHPAPPGTPLSSVGAFGSSGPFASSGSPSSLGTHGASGSLVSSGPLFGVSATYGNSGAFGSSGMFNSSGAFGSPGPVGSSATMSSSGGRATSTSPPALQQQQFLHLYPPFMQNQQQISTSVPSAGYPNVAMTQQMLLQRPAVSGAEFESQIQQQLHSFSLQQYQQFMAQGLARSTQSQIISSAPPNPIYLPASSLAHSNTHQQQLMNSTQLGGPPTYLSSGVQFIGNPQHQYMNSFQHLNCSQNSNGSPPVTFVNTGQYLPTPPASQPFVTQSSQTPNVFSQQMSSAAPLDLESSAGQAPSNPVFVPFIHAYPVQQLTQPQQKIQLSNKSMHGPPANLYLMPHLSSQGPVFYGRQEDGNSSVSHGGPQSS